MLNKPKYYLGQTQKYYKQYYKLKVITLAYKSYLSKMPNVYERF